MNKQIEQVRAFHQAFGHSVRSKPTYMTTERAEMRIDILREEIAELEDAMINNDLVEVADGIIDAMYILIGHALEFGIAHKLEACFDEVQRSNMSKLGPDGLPIYREDGKIMKGPNYERPALGEIILSDMLQ